MAETSGIERRIMVTVDEGDESMYALSWCLKNLAFQNDKDHLILLYVKPPRVVYSAFDGTGYLFSSDITATMERVSQQVEVKAESGDPRDVICQMVQKWGVDVLVMGSHGYGVIKRAFLGSVSNHCAQNVKCPVVIVKKPKSTAGEI